MEWRELYEKKLVSAEEAVSKIKSNNRVVIGLGAGEPRKLVDEMVNNKDNYENVEIVNMLTLGNSDYIKPEMAKHFKYNSIFISGKTKGAVASGQADYTPCFFYEIPDMFRNGSLDVNVALIQVTTPDEHGYCSFGISNDYTKGAAKEADIVIAQVNENMPRVMGDSFIHVSDIDYIVEGTETLTEVKPAKIGEIEKKIGENCAKLIEDGSTLQLGIGAIPDAVLLFLEDKKDLGIHSEMISDGVVELVEKGIINNKNKSIHPGKIVVTFLMGTKRLYDFVNNNPMIESYSVDYVNNPLVIMKNSKMVSINSCLQVDFMGQVSSESIGDKQISGVGGQVDFVRGTNMSKDGISIIAMPSTASRGKISRIVSQLDPGAAVTTSRNDVNYIVTEYGIAKLKGKSLKERARALINIASPTFKNELIGEFESRFNCKY